MPNQLISLDLLRAELRAGRKPGDSVYRLQVANPMIVDEEARKIRFVFSDGTIDRMKDTIDPNGWDTSAYLKNPVVLWAHDSSAPPIGRCSNLAVEAEALCGDVEFAAPEVYDFADLIYRLVKAKYLNAGSVGFLPIDYSFSSDKERPYGIDFKHQELLEYSICPVPANPNALAEARAHGIDTRPLVGWAELVLDGDGRLILPKAEVDAMRRQAKEPHSRVPPTDEERLAMKNGGRRDGGGMGEGDPAAGGYVANCGRAIGAECGLKNPEECMVHGPAMTEGKGLDAAIRRIIDEVLREAGGDGDGDAPSEHLKRGREHVAAAQEAAKGIDGEDPQHEAVVGMHAHVKAADGYLDSYRSAGSLAAKSAIARVLRRVTKDDGPEAEMTAADHVARASDHVDAANEHLKDLIIIDPDGDEDLSDDDDAQEHVLAMHAHVKAADGYLESYRSLDMGDPEAEKAARIARIEALRVD